MLSKYNEQKKSVMCIIVLFINIIIKKYILKTILKNKEKLNLKNVLIFKK